MSNPEQSASSPEQALPAAPSDENPLYYDPITDPQIAKTASDAWLTAFFASPAGHRTNAQAGYTIAAAVATAIVGAGILTGVDQAPVWVQIPLMVALLLWLWTAWAFMRTVAFQPHLGGVEHASDLGRLGTIAIQRTWLERSKIAKRSRRAQKIARWAGVVTFIAVGLTLFRPALATVDATIALSDAGKAHIAALCGIDLDKITARVDPDRLDDSIVKLDDVACPDAETRKTLRLPKADIAGAATN